VSTAQVTPRTREAICNLLAWDFRQLQQGTWDILDRFGKFHPLGSKRERKSGQHMPVKGEAGL
jgi:hypothetical protein